MGSDVMGPTFLALIMLNAMFAIVASCPGRQRTDLCRYTKAVLQGIAAMFRPARKVN
jgi:hypothetical protein